ncbi:uncharacterized protein F4817DRAFT_11240 [Daldinia loculata]|uniref:uncharacterized protein n=1 Tax=Daldinia loculata TaxID=103429 RepID=UPI0020C513F2|nr:uncharacterized protein F4817DRAFT_11240 [Daldinia loculata]KAI1652340.1 hypothetical protein F4817DRAFT_11240 [Daldinia loculata]
MALTFTTFDVFTKTAFRGTPLGIIYVLANTQLTQDQKQLIARELKPLQDGYSCTSRPPPTSAPAPPASTIFTPLAEIPFLRRPPPPIGTANYTTSCTTYA